jgi:DNA primase
MIDQKTIDDCRDLDLLTVVNKFNDIQLKKNGSSYRGFSPWSKEKTPSFYVHPVKGIYKDFSSGKGGDNAIRFVMDKEGFDFVDAVKWLCQEFSIEIKFLKNGNDDGKTTQERLEVRDALQWALAHFCGNEVPEDFVNYREFPEDVIDVFKIGYAKNSWDDLYKAATKAGFKPDVLVNAGLIRPRVQAVGLDGSKGQSAGYYDYFRDRIIFPIFDRRGNVVAFTARDAETEDQTQVIDQQPEKKEKPPKYINSPDTCYDKSKSLYGLYQCVKSNEYQKGVYLVEGPTDVMRMHQHNLKATVAPCGSALTDEQAKVIRKLTDKLVIVPDNDCGGENGKNAGIDALHRNAPVAIKAGLQVKVLIPGSTK